jgi:hypothetical protein
LKRVFFEKKSKKLFPALHDALAQAARFASSIAQRI